MSSIEERIFDTVVERLETMVSPSIIAVDITPDPITGDSIEWTDRDKADGYMLPWVTVQTHDQNLQPIGLNEGGGLNSLQYDTPAIFVEYGNIGDQYTPSLKDIPTFMEFPSLGFIREMTQIFLRVVLFDPNQQDDGAPEITKQIARARQDIRKCIGDNIRPVIEEVYQTWVGPYIRSHESYYTDTAEFIIPVEVWWRYDYRSIDREETATSEGDSRIYDLEFDIDDDSDLRVQYKTSGTVTASNIYKEVRDYRLGKDPNEFSPDTINMASNDRAGAEQLRDDYQKENLTYVAHELQKNTPEWDPDTFDAIDTDTYPPTTVFPDAIWHLYYDKNDTHYIKLSWGDDPRTVIYQRRHDDVWEDVDITDNVPVTVPDTVDGVKQWSWTDTDWHMNNVYRIELADESMTPVLRYPYYPTTMPESVYDEGDSPEEKLERKIRQEIQKELDKGDSRKYFSGVNNVYSGPLSPTYLDVDNLPMICIMFDKSAIDVGQPVSGRGVGFRTANTNDESLSFTAMVHATADKEYTDPYQNVRIVDNVLSDLREFVIDYEQFDNVSGTFASIVGPISFPRIAQDVAGDLLFIGVFEFFIRYRPGG